MQNIKDFDFLLPGIRYRLTFRIEALSGCINPKKALVRDILNYVEGHEFSIHSISVDDDVKRLEIIATVTHPMGMRSITAADILDCSDEVMVYYEKPNVVIESKFKENAQVS